MQVEEYVAQHTQRAVARLVVVLNSENRTVNLGLLRILQTLQLFLAFFGDVLLQAFRILLDATEQPWLFLPVIFRHPSPPPLPCSCLLRRTSNQLPISTWKNCRSQLN